jgi:hypothetical protein
MFLQPVGPCAQPPRLNSAKAAFHMLATDLSSSHLQERVKKRFTSIGRCQEKAKVRRGAVDLGQEKTSAPTLSE